MTESAPPETNVSDGWADFLKGTADRPPSQFFELAMEYVGPIRDDHHPLAIDLGCGGGSETRALLARGWRVFATDSSPAAETLIRRRVDPADESRLTIAIGSFTDVDLPAADLVYAQMSLPFAGSELDDATDHALSATRSGGVFAGHFFGPGDDWIDGVNTAAVERNWINQKLGGWTDLTIHETEEDGPYGLEGDIKHWHYYFVMARR